MADENIGETVLALACSGFGWQVETVYILTDNSTTALQKFIKDGAAVGSVDSCFPEFHAATSTSSRA